MLPHSGITYKYGHLASSLLRHEKHETVVAGMSEFLQGMVLQGSEGSHSWQCHASL